MQLQNRISLQFIPSIDEASGIEDSSVAFGWWLETLLARVRWCAVPTCVITVWLFPTIPSWLLLLPALGYGLGNIAVTWSLRQPRSGERLRSVRGLATMVDWLSAFGSIYAFSAEPAAATPAVLLLLSVTTALRYQLLGLIFAAIATLFIISILVAAQVLIFGVLDRAQAAMIVGSWAVVMGVLVLVLGVLTCGFESWQSNEHTIRDNVHDTIMRLRYGLTERERQVLTLLPKHDLTYEDIGRELSISSGTVKAHVRHIGEKLGVRGRHAVVSEAYRHGLLSSGVECMVEL